MKMKKEPHNKVIRALKIIWLKFNMKSFVEVSPERIIKYVIIITNEYKCVDFPLQHRNIIN